jgi:dephospho-CoA kinase
MLRVGLTGGIASGKTTVARMLQNLGVPVLEADPLAHFLIEPGESAYEAVVREFGTEVLRADGFVDRSKLAEIVFADREKLERLNRIVHPGVREAIERWFTELEQGGGVRVAVVEAALLVEAGYRDQLDRLVVAWCRPEQQLERLLARGLTREQAERRIAAQMPAEEKRRLADDVIDCSGSLEDTRRQVEALARRLAEQAAQKD